MYKRQEFAYQVEKAKEIRNNARREVEQELRLVNPRLLILVGGLAIKLLYPPSVRLDEIIGTAAYFPPEVADPLNFDLNQAQIVTSDELRVTSDELTRHSSLVARH